MKGHGYQIAIYRIGRERSTLEEREMSIMEDREMLTLDDLAAHTGLHPAVIEQFFDYGLIEAAERAGSQSLFDLNCVSRLRKIERLRHELGANLASVAVILDLLDRINTLQNEVEQLRMAAP
jgi:MerR family transcriptional regulator/heat shock protein HspR